VQSSDGGGCVAVVYQRSEIAALECGGRPAQDALEARVCANEPPLSVQNAEKVGGEIEKPLEISRRHDKLVRAAFFM
jgi:hypothetical protein